MSEDVESWYLDTFTQQYFMRDQKKMKLERIIYIAISIFLGVK